MLGIQKQYGENFLLTMTQLSQQELTHPCCTGKYMLPLELLTQMSASQLHHRL